MGPTAITMTFRESPNVAMAQVAVVDAAGLDLVAEPPTGAGTSLTQPLRAASTPGPVTVTYRVVSTDGHPIQGKITFTVTSAATASSAVNSPSPAPASAAAPAVAPSASASSGAAAEADEPIEPWGVAFVVGALAGLIAIAAALAFWPRGRQPDPAAPPTASDNT
ncbi:hypothetical protein GCM10007977_081120 [Dactylosporangium sucinum]|uniref:CopC domain-containing protein n=2 Tax=Dactylosporangium sucinum TaxID=1424081 RepID=A0A917UBY2_9ACTN|nr:hypothetical protein GCM10007977_081120 [Dactylosporangium sucinum]